MKSLTKEIPGFEHGYLIDTNAQLGGRDSRRIKGVYRHTKNDYMKDFEDTIALNPEYTVTQRGYAKIPYRCLISPNSKNTIWAGRCISVDHEVFDLFRSIPCCMATGQAAGVAAALASKNPDPYSGIVDKVDINKLKKILVQQGAILEIG